MEEMLRRTLGPGIQIVTAYRTNLPAIRVDPSQLASRNHVLGMVAPGEGDEGGEGSGQTQNRHPPDVPDQGEADHGREHRGHESRRTVARYLDRLVGRLRTQAQQVARLLLHAPIRLLHLHIRHDREIERRRR
jgi:hypothetical protein